ncbi:MAG: cytochrome c biogenesis protein CcdA [bacterium]
MRYLLALIIVTSMSAGAVSPFQVSVRSFSAQTEGIDIIVALTMPTGHVVYAESFKVLSDPAAVCRKPAPTVEKQDLFEPAKRVKVFAHAFETIWRMPSIHDGMFVTVGLQGCNEKVCFLPETRQFRFRQAENRFVESVGDASAEPVGVDWKQGRSVTTIGGYLSASELLAFFDRIDGKLVAEPSAFAGFLENPITFFKRYGAWLTVLLVLIGGVLLNLTPCVLPMIPINLAIIGASDGRRGRGFLLGCAYGLGMTITYGGSGWAVIKSGIFFGALQSSPWFSLSVALIFALLSLALFDLFAIDLTRFSGTKGNQRKGLITAFAAGALSAILAGACVAPVVLAVLLLAGTLTTEGVSLAQFFPFVLGLGMALPWPFAGAGLSVLPRPGKWMVRVKQAFGVSLIGLSVYYGYLAVIGFIPAVASERKGSIMAGDMEAWRKALAQAEQESKPVFVDFWATWCKNCTAMEKTTFKDSRVAERLKSYKVILVQAEHPERAEPKKMLEAFGIRGLPGFAVVKLY